MYGSGNQRNQGSTAASVLRKVVRTYQVDKFNARVNAENNSMTFHFGSEGLNLPADATNVVTGVPLVLFWNNLDNITTPSYISVKVPAHGFICASPKTASFFSPDTRVTGFFLA
jgi:hypothetical protein